MIINHNMMAMNAHRQLGANSLSSKKSMEKLSSGLRINRAGDDAAGLAISEKMRAQIRGLNQATRNAQDGISMIQTAEGALTESHSILQRMRELSVQAANDTNTEKDRDQLQKEMNQLTSEINRIGNTTEFNTQKMLDGGASKVEEDVKETKMEAKVTGETLDLSKLDLDTTTKKLAFKVDGKDVELTTDYTSKTIEDVKTDLQAALEKAGVEGVTVGVDEGKLTLTSEKDIKIEDGTGTKNLAALGLKAGDVKAEEIEVEAEPKNGAVEAKAATAEAQKVGATDGNTLSFDAGVDNGAKANEVKIVVSKTAGTEDDPKAEFDKDSNTVTITLAKDAKQANNTADKIQEAIQKLGAEGEVDFSKFTVKGEGALEKGKAGITAGGEDATFEMAGGADAKEAEEAQFTAKLQIGANTGQAFTMKIGDMRAEALGISKVAEAGEAGEAEEAEEVKASAEVTGEAVANFDLSAADLKFKVNGKEVTLAKKNYTNKEELATDLQEAIKTALGNEDVKVSIADDKLSITSDKDIKIEKNGVSGNDGDLAKLGLKEGTTKAEMPEVEEAEETTGAKFTEIATVTNGTDDENVEYALDISTHDNATAAIEVIDVAINKVSTQRSQLGAYQNRLEHTINNLSASSENLQAAESRVRDVDMAAEMVKFQKNNILQQAAQAMLAQANQAPQGVLQLLR